MTASRVAAGRVTAWRAPGTIWAVAAVGVVLRLVVTERIDPLRLVPLACVLAAAAVAIQLDRYQPLLRRATIAVAPLAIVGVAAATADRVSGLVAALGLVTADATIGVAPGAPMGITLDAGRRLALAVAVAAQLVWVVAGAWSVVLALDLLAIGLVGAVRRSPAVAERLDVLAAAAQRRTGEAWARHVRRSHEPGSQPWPAAVIQRTRSRGAAIARARGPWSRWITLDAVVAGVVVAALMYPVFLRLASDPTNQVSGFNDLFGYLTVIKDMSFSPYSIPPQVVYFASSWALMHVSSVAVASTLVLSAGSALAVVALARFGRQRTSEGAVLSRRGAVLFALFIALSESPTALLIATGLTSKPTSYASVHLWASPTETISVGFNVMLLIVLLVVIDRPSADRSTRWALLVTTTLAMLAKPSFATMLVPALPIYLVVTRRWTRERVAVIARWCLAPMIAVFVAQSIVMVAFVPAAVRSGMEIAPFEVLPTLGIGRGGPVYYLGLALVVLCACAGGRRYLRDPAVGLSLVALVCSFGPLLLLRETGANGYNAGNVAKPAAMCWFMLYMSSARFAFAELSTLRRPVRRRSALTRVWAGALVVFLASASFAGAAVYLDAAGVVTTPQPVRHGSG